MEKILAMGVCGLMAAGVCAGCGGGSGDSGKMKVGVVQIVQHPPGNEFPKIPLDNLFHLVYD